MLSKKIKKGTSTRRSFIKKTVAASSIFIVPRHVLGGLGYTSPSDQLALAGIGVGGKGETDLRNAWVKGRERVVAICDVDGSGKGSVGKSVKRFTNASFYDNFKKMLDTEKILMQLPFLPLTIPMLPLQYMQWNVVFMYIFKNH